MRKINIKNHRTGGVLLKFDPPFEDIPSLIVSPQLSKQDTLSRISTDVVRLPHVVVEHLTEEGALIRVGLLDTFSVGVSSTTNSCSSSPSSPNVKETFIPKFNKVSVYLTEKRCQPSSVLKTVTHTLCLVVLIQAWGY